MSAYVSLQHWTEQLFGGANECEGKRKTSKLNKNWKKSTFYSHATAWCIRKYHEHPWILKVYISKQPILTAHCSHFTANDEPERQHNGPMDASQTHFESYCASVCMPLPEQTRQQCYICTHNAGSNSCLRFVMTATSHAGHFFSKIGYYSVSSSAITSLTGQSHRCTSFVFNRFLFKTAAATRYLRAKLEKKIKRTNWSAIMASVSRSFFFLFCVCFFSGNYLPER